VSDLQTITIDQVFPWGRSFDEYRAMFALTEADLDLRILGCADGPSAFNAAMTARGKRAISVDPLYSFSAQEIRDRVTATHDVLVERATRIQHRFVWDRIGSPKEMGQLRLNSMNEFLADFEAGKEQGRYLEQSLPELNFADKSFDLTLCSHFLFLYSDEFSAEFHIAAIEEMCRVANECRIFPLLNMKGRRSKYVDAVVKHFDASVERVDYEFQRDGNEMLRVRAS
jgi:hypothetical protein